MSRLVPAAQQLDGNAFIGLLRLHWTLLEVKIYKVLQPVIWRPTNQHQVLQEL